MWFGKNKGAAPSYEQIQVMCVCWHVCVCVWACVCLCGHVCVCIYVSKPVQSGQFYAVHSDKLCLAQESTQDNKGLGFPAS